MSKKQYFVNDLDALQEEFYKTYNPDYWLYKTSLLKNCHDNFSHIKEVAAKDIAGQEGQFPRPGKGYLVGLQGIIFWILTGLYYDNRNYFSPQTYCAGN